MNLGNYKPAAGSNMNEYMYVMETVEVTVWQ